MFAGGVQGLGTLPGPMALQAVNPAPALVTQEAGGDKIRNRPDLNLTADGSAANASGPKLPFGTPAAEVARKEAAEPFLLDAPFLSSFRANRPNAIPGQPQETFSSPVPMHAANVQPKAAAAAEGAQTASVASVGPGAARVKATYGVDAALLSGSKNPAIPALGQPAKQVNSVQNKGDKQLPGRAAQDKETGTSGHCSEP